MAATWRLIFFKTFFLEFPRNLVGYIYRFSGSASLLVLSVYMWDWKRGCGGHFGFINYNESFLFSINCLETWHIESHCMSRGVFECLHGIFKYFLTYSDIKRYIWLVHEDCFSEMSTVSHTRHPSFCKLGHTLYCNKPNRLLASGRA